MVVAQNGSDVATQADKKLRLVVGVAASAGGLKAYSELVADLHPGDGIAYVFVQHLDPVHHSLTAEILGQITELPVTEIQADEEICPDHIYIIPPNRYLSIKRGCFKLEPPAANQSVRMPIDEFFRSLAQEFSQRSVAIVLTGTGTDGSIGIRHMHEQGGIVIIQDPKSAEFDGMPSSAQNTGFCDFVLAISAMASKVSGFITQNFHLDASHESTNESENFVRSVISILRTKSKHDFRDYKRGTLIRRIQRRMSLKSRTQTSEYLEFLRKDPLEADELFHDLLIGVTAFFRDAEAFDELANVIQESFNKKTNPEQFRVWVPGCSTGEEAYSIAILAQAACDASGSGTQIQIFATDVDEGALDIARRGRYPKTAVKDVPTHYLNQYFTASGEDYVVSQSLRERVIFATQNLTSDAPFSRLDLISCRNLLIYLNADIQGRLMSLFHFSLSPQGHLFLGSTESASRVENLFMPISKKWRLYQKIGFGSALGATFPIREVPARALPATPAATESGRSSSLSTIARDALINQFAPTAVLIDKQFAIDYFHGSTSEFLNQPSGEPTRHLLDMARDGLRTRLRAAVHRANTDNQLIKTTAKRMRREGRNFSVEIFVQPIDTGTGDRRFLVSFAYSDKQPNRAADVEISESDDLALRQLESELQVTREDLQSTIEELEAANEELRAANEEVMSMNEETQSSNEELETSREELQSLNEELSTLNSQLEEKLHELETTNDDLANLLVSTKIAMIFLDTEGCIRRFTPETTQLLNVIDADIGRPLQDLAPNVEDPDLLEDIQLVLSNLTPIEKTVSAGAQTFMRRVLPYRTSDNRIAGVAIAYTNISVVQEAMLHAQLGESRQTALAQLAGSVVNNIAGLATTRQLAVSVLGANVSVNEVEIWELDASSGFIECKATQSDRSSASAAGLIPTSRQPLVADAIASKQPRVLDDIQGHNRPTIQPEFEIAQQLRAVVQPLTVTGNTFGAISMYRCDGAPFAEDELIFTQAIANVLAVIIERTYVKFERSASEERFRGITTQMGMILAIVDTQGHYEYVSDNYAEFFGLEISVIQKSQASAIWSNPTDNNTDNDALTHLERALQGDATSFEFSGRTQLGKFYDARVSLTPRKDPHGKVTGIYVAALDLTTYKQVEANKTLAEASEQERRRIGQALHTTIGQELTGLSMIAESNADALAQAKSGAAPTARRVSDGLAEVLEHVRLIARGLDVVSENLLGELNALASDINAIEGLECVFMAASELRQPSDNAAASLYQIAQEAASNAVRHATASRITISLAAEDDLLILKVVDDGAGLPQGGNSAEGMGMGMRIMRYRADLLNGRLSVESEPTGGTRVVCKVPVEGLL